MNPATRHGVGDGFAGDGGPVLFCDDADRLTAAGRLSPQTAAVGVGADASLVAVPVESVAWLEVRRLCAGLMVVVVVVVVVQLCGVP
jgi:hypothetical protein